MAVNPSSNLIEQWKGLHANQKAALGVAVLLLALTVMVVVSKANTVTYVQLYGNLTPEDAAVVVQRLKDLKVPYRLHEQGGSVEVPAKQVDELRLTLAGDGIPRGGNVGFELFDKTQVGQSEFGERLKYQRALQGELARTISQLKGVRASRVHLALPERRLYRADAQKPTASVVLDLKGGTPAPREIKSIIHLVSSAVEGLDPVDVTVVDTTGNLLSDLPGLAGNAGSTMQLQVQREVEVQVEQRVQSMLDNVLGPGKAVVRANVKVNFTRRTIDRERFSPADPEHGVGVLERQQRTVETYTGSRPGTPSGLAGVAANATLLGREGANGGNTYSREESTTQYRVTRETEQINTLPGEVERISLALLIDESFKTRIEELKPTIEAAAGLETARGDQLAIQAIKFDTSLGEAAEKAAKEQARAGMMLTMGKYAAAAVLIAAFFVFIFHIYRSTLLPVTAQILPDELPSYPAVLPVEQAAVQYAAFSAPVEPEHAPRAHEAALDNLDPARVAKVIKSLMAEERRD